jgi:hypothetical protein
MITSYIKITILYRLPIQTIIIYMMEMFLPKKTHNISTTDLIFVLKCW